MSRDSVRLIVGVVLMWLSVSGMVLLVARAWDEHARRAAAAKETQCTALYAVARDHTDSLNIALYRPECVLR